MATFHRDGTSVDNTASANDSEPKSASQASSNFTTYFGLQNEGNTCFLNSLLQCLYLTPEFKKLSRCESECGETLSEIKKIFNALQKKKSVSTSKLAACLGLKPFKQQDVPEVFHLLLNKLDHELSNGLLFKKLYESTMVSLTECTQCVKKDGLHIGCNIVILPLPVSSLRNGEQCCSVTDALEHFLRSSEMKGENQMYCSDCREKTDATLRQALTRLPRILVVQLKRFDFSFYEQRFVKLDNAMHINTTLEVPCEMELQKDKKSYDLFAICDHYGGFKSGHYSAIIKPEENDKWFRFDDSIVTSEEILDPEREKSLRGKSSGEKYDLSRSRTAYVLMYRQKLEREPQKSAPFPTDLWTPQPSALPMVIPQDTTGASLLLPTQKSRNGPAHAMVLNVRGDNEIEIMHGSDETAEPVHLVDLLHNERNAEQKVDALTRQNGDAEHVPNMQTRRNELQSAEVINICMPQNDLGVVQAASRLQSHIAVKSEGVPNTKKPQNEQTSESNTNIRVSQGNQIGDVIKHFFVITQWDLTCTDIRVASQMNLMIICIHLRII
ncbi:ubiquitin carboxyl-terminal hydrolase 12A-like isoform X1 [Pleurodeles waltl]|uniref:ubiquitin carboxyl-terminal hydrolase 12A-like isoform X1 n=1 Tax=Pleurodeles waltl TaxID=8319 RepID=UPI00370953DB